MAILAAAGHAQAMSQGAADKLCEHAYAHIDLGRALNRSGVSADDCMDAVEAKVDALRKDATFLAPLEGIQFDQRVYLYMVIGGTAFSQCMAPKDVSHAEFQKTTCRNIDMALPLKKNP